MASPVTPGAVDARLILPDVYQQLEAASFDWGIPSHLVSVGAAPVQLGALQANMTSQTLVAGSTDLSGSVTLVVTGTPPAAGAALCLIVFAQQYANHVNVVVSATSSSSTQFTPVVIAKTVAGFTIANGTVIVPASQTVTVDYITAGN